MSWNSPWSQNLTNSYGLTDHSSCNYYDNGSARPYTSASAESYSSYPVKGDYSSNFSYYYNGNCWVPTGCSTISASYQGTNPNGTGLYERK